MPFTISSREWELEILQFRDPLLNRKPSVQKPGPRRKGKHGPSSSLSMVVAVLVQPSSSRWRRWICPSWWRRSASGWPPSSSHGQPRCRYLGMVCLPFNHPSASDSKSKNSTSLCIRATWCGCSARKPSSTSSAQTPLPPWTPPLPSIFTTGCARLLVCWQSVRWFVRTLGLGNEPLLPSLPYPTLTSHNSCCFSELVHALGKSVAVNDLLPATAAYDSQLWMNCYSQELNVESWAVTSSYLHGALVVPFCFTGISELLRAWEDRLFLHAWSGR